MVLSSATCQLTAATTTLMPTTLTLYSDWRLCSACGSPPETTKSLAEANGDAPPTSPRADAENRGTPAESKPPWTKKLLTCQRCKTAAYHDALCQKAHWKAGHKRDCRKLAEAIQPLRDLIACQNEAPGSTARRRATRSSWWDADPETARECDRAWATNEVRWNRYGEYLAAMDGFQKALEPFARAWKDRTTSRKAEKTLPGNNENHQRCDREESLSMSELSVRDGQNSDDDTASNTAQGISLARRLLFCAYCEADGQQIQSARMRLVQCLSVLLECSGRLSSSRDDKNGDRPNERLPGLNESTLAALRNDAWMELMLSYEEEASPELRTISRHVAHLAIQTSCLGGYRCEWKDPLQRPGYMAALDRHHFPDDDAASNRGSEAVDPSFVPSESHPAWCQTLESHWKDIANELSSLVETKSHHHRTKWTAVGCGDRGSGGDDHRVVSAGGKWTEYVLFGTGAANLSDADAPITKRLLRDYVPEAVSLAEAGGGEVIFSRLAPRTRIEAHCGPTNLRWTAHLGLVIPDGECKIRVSDRWHYWQAGMVLLFDDSYEHEIRNDTQEARIVLLLRLWHPALSRNQRQRELLKARRKKEEAVEKRYHAPSV